MSHLWSEFYAQYCTDLERLVVEILQTSSEGYLNSLMVRLNEVYGIEIEMQSFTNDAIILALRALSCWPAFVSAVAAVLGTKDKLLLDWQLKFGGRVFIPVTGGGFTSTEVLQWMNDVFMPRTSTGM